MALTQISTGGIKDTTIANADLANEAVNEAKIQISNAGTNGQYLQKQSGNTGGLTWADVPAGVGGATGVDFNDGVKAQWGIGSDLRIQHTSNHSHIHNTTGDLRIRSNKLELRNEADDESYLEATNGGAIELYHDNVLALKTDPYGLIVTAPNTANASTVLIKGFEAKDAQILLQADEADDSADTYKILGSTDGSWYLQDLSNGSSYETNIKATGGASVELYHNNSKRFETTSLGAKVTGNLQMGGTAGVNFTHTGTTSIYESQTAGDALLFKTTPSGGSSTERLRITSAGYVSLVSDSGRLTVGAGDDLQIYHTGSQSRIENSGTGELRIQADTIQITDKEANDMHIQCVHDGAIQLYHDNVKKVETTATGFLFDGTGGDTYWLDNSDSNGLKWRYTDNVKGCYGTGDDLTLYHDGSNSYIKNATGHLRIYGSGTADSHIYLQPNDGNDGIRILNEGEVQLYYNNAMSFKTTSDGIRIYGAEGGDCNLYLYADEGDDNADKWRFAAATNGGLYIQNYGLGSWDNDFVINSAGKVSIMGSGASNLGAAHADADDLVVGYNSSSPTGISIMSANDGYGCINWADASDNDVARISYNHNGDIFSVATNAAERIRQTSNITRIGQFSTVNGTNGGLDIEWTGGTSKRSYVQSYTAHTSANESLMSFGNGNGLSGKIVVSDGDVNFADASDYRLKQDQADITDGITRVKQLKPCSFKWKVNTDVTVEGFYAHEVQSIVPQAVVGEKDAVDSNGEIDPQLLKPVNLIPVLTAALKEAITKIETLETKVAALEAA